MGVAEDERKRGVLGVRERADRLRGVGAAEEPRDSLRGDREEDDSPRRPVIP